MKLENKVFELKDFAREMAKLKNEKHFDFLVTIVGEDLVKKDWELFTSSKTLKHTSA